MKRLLAAVLTLVLLAACFPLNITAWASNGTDFAQMLERAEAIVNYTWVPSEDIETWYHTPYNGSIIFPAGEPVVGMPYTLFAWELGTDSLLSLEQYEKKAQSNYNATAFCGSRGEERTGPAYGSCCATFVCEILGGKFMNGSNPRHDSVRGLKNSSYGTTSYRVKPDKIRPGDALSNTDVDHVVWVGAVTDTYFVVYEQTPPVARKTIIYKSSVNEEGYLVYNGDVYSTVTRSKQLDLKTLPADGQCSAYCPIRAYPSAEQDFKVKYANRTANHGTIDTDDYCTILAVYYDGWCRVSYPNSGTTKTSYTPLSNFIWDPDFVFKAYTAGQDIPVFTHKDLAEQMPLGITAGMEFQVVSKCEGSWQVLYSTGEEDGSFALGWITGELLHSFGYTVYFDACGGENGPRSQQKTHGEVLTLDLQQPQRLNHIFMAWNTEPDGSGETYRPGDLYTADDDLHLYAQWQHICAEGHAFGPWEITAPATYIREGQRQHKCIHCGEIHTEVIPVLGSLMGDVNHDGFVDGADAMLLRQFVARWKLTGFFPENADLDENEIIDGEDAMLIRQLIAK